MGGNGNDDSGKTRVAAGKNGFPNKMSGGKLEANLGIGLVLSKCRVLCSGDLFCVTVWKTLFWCQLFSD